MAVAVDEVMACSAMADIQLKMCCCCCCCCDDSAEEAAAALLLLMLLLLFRWIPLLMEEAGVVDGDVPAQLDGLAFADSDADVGAAATCPAESTAPTAEAADDDHTSAAAFCKSQYPSKDTFEFYISFHLLKWIFSHYYFKITNTKFLKFENRIFKYDDPLAI